MKVYQQIKKYRKLCNFSQEELAEKIYVSRQTISNWENGKSYPDIDNLLRLSSLFEISLDTLIKGDVDLMKKKLSSHDMDIWTGVMIIFWLLAIFVGIPMTYFLGWIGIGVIATLFVIYFAAAVRVDLIKKKNDLKTYKEIVAFTNNQELSLEEKVKDRQGYWKRELLLILVSGLITAFLSFIVIIIVKMILY
ncbi:helix-turn-helix transcriptional regulator [Companilactobacillus musae]|uniref:helix-turn-helix domain-containing protein n=1 Tax=Companilactobacillus musae TaxID=1903258 RepID=UPI0013C36802|nr:helix-turn-helix transcriptional regulator [Companilactobacillus musae]